MERRGEDENPVRAAVVTTTGSRFALSAAAAYLLGIAALLATILALNEGSFTYSLDDPYIHLALAESIAAGEYGLNAGEPASPSSSALWPFLLAPFAQLSQFDLLPLVLGIVFMTVMIWSFAAALRHRLAPRLSTAAQGVLLLLMALAFNFWGLPLNGMEHTAQLLLTLWVALGMIEVAETGKVRWTLLVGLVLGPLVRFENLGLLLPAAWVLWVRRRHGTAILAGGLVATAVATYCAFLHGQGLPLLPSSVMVKSELAASDGGWTALGAIFENFSESLFKSRIQASLVLIYLLWRRQRAETDPESSSRDRLYCVFLAGLVASHMLAGRYGWSGRYEIYLVLAVAAVGLYAFRHSLERLVARPSAAMIWIFLPLFLYFGKNQLHATLTTPLSANNVYEMQVQMHRFAVEFWRDGVAVNDVGRVAFRNPHYVLDLWGLGSDRARRARRENSDNAWMDQLAGERGTDLVMIFEPWFSPNGPLPANWERAAELRVPGWAIEAPVRTVTFFLRAPSRRGELAEALARFAPTLPPGVELRATLSPPAPMRRAEGTGVPPVLEREALTGVHGSR